MESFLDGGVCGSRGELKLTFCFILQVKPTNTHSFIKNYNYIINHCNIQETKALNNCFIQFRVP